MENKIKKLNSLKTMGFSYDLSDEKIQERLLREVESNINFIMDGYNNSYLNYDSPKIDDNDDIIQIVLKKDDSLKTIKDKFKNINFHHSNNCVWRSIIEETISEKDSIYFIKPSNENARNIAVIKYLNSDILASIEKGDVIFSQVNCFAYDINFFKKGDEEKDKRFRLSLNVAEEKELFLPDNSILLAKAFHHKNDIYDYLNYVSGDILDIKKIKNKVLDEIKEYYLIVADTEFGKTPIVVSQDNVNDYNIADYNIGDSIEALCSITGDLVIYQNQANVVRDKLHYMQIIKRAFESKNMILLNGILSEQAEYISDRHTYKGKKEVIEKLQWITDEGYSNIEVDMHYGMISKNPINGFQIGDEVLLLGNDSTGEYGIEADINIELDENNYVSKILLTNDPNIKFKTYDSEGRYPISDLEKEKAREIMKLLEQMKYSNIDIHNVLQLAYGKEYIIDKLLDHVKTLKSENAEKENLLNFVFPLYKEFDESHPIKRMLSKKYDSSGEYIAEKYKDKESLTWRVNYNNEYESKKLMVTTDDSLVGEMKVLLDNYQSFVCYDLMLQYGDLSELKEDKRESIGKIDLYNDEKDYHYNYKKLFNKVEEELDLYDGIVFYSYFNKIDDYLLPYFFINRFYKKVKNKDIRILYIDGFSKNKELQDYTNDDVEKLFENVKRLTSQEVKEYKEFWDEVIKQKSEIRDVVNKKVVYHDKKYYYDKILKIVKELKKEFGDELDRVQVIRKCAFENLIHGGNICVYNDIIQNMIDEKILISSDYKIIQFMPRDFISIAE